MMSTAEVKITELIANCQGLGRAFHDLSQEYEPDFRTILPWAGCPPLFTAGRIIEYLAREISMFRKVMENYVGGQFAGSGFRPVRQRRTSLAATFFSSFGAAHFATGPEARRAKLACWSVGLFPMTP